MNETNWQSTLRDSPVVEVAKRSRAHATVPDPGAAKPKKRKKSSSGVLFGLGVGERRLLQGLATAAGDYQARSAKSAGAKRDGAVRDVLKNLLRAQEKAVLQLTKIPNDLTKSKEYKRVSKRARRLLRRLAW
jgi:hypothetical protein